MHSNTYIYTMCKITKYLYNIKNNCIKKCARVIIIQVTGFSKHAIISVLIFIIMHFFEFVGTQSLIIWKLLVQIFNLYTLSFTKTKKNLKCFKPGTVYIVTSRERACYIICIYVITSREKKCRLFICIQFWCIRAILLSPHVLYVTYDIIKILIIYLTSCSKLNSSL